jgi:hypothetical protein
MATTSSHDAAPTAAAAADDDTAESAAAIDAFSSLSLSRNEREHPCRACNSHPVQRNALSALSFVL